MMRRPFAIVFSVLLALSAAGCKTRLYELDDIADGPPRIDAAHIPDLAPPPDLTLPRVCRNIYVIDSNNFELSSFDPPTGKFTDLGRIKCPGGSSPESMAIGRDDTAWVSFADGKLYHVNTDTAACAATPYKIQHGLSGLIGMGFSSDQPGGTAETLYVVGGTNLVLVSRDLSTFVDTVIGHVPVSPELTGTGAAELFGFFPSMGGGTPAMIARVDKKTAALDQVIPIPQFANGGAAAFAFAFWGGSFFIFLQQNADPSTSVYRVDAKTGKLTTVLMDTGRHIVGAGVSACAPLGLDQ